MDWNMDKDKSPGVDVQCDVEMVTRSDPDTEPEWVPGGRRLFSGLLGLNVIMLGAALVAANTFYANGQLRQGPQVFILLLLLLSVIWMLWYLLWSRKRPGRTPHTDHHAGGVTITGKPGRFNPDGLSSNQPRSGVSAKYLEPPTELKSNSKSPPSPHACKTNSLVNDSEKAEAFGQSLFYT